MALCVCFCVTRVACAWYMLCVVYAPCVLCVCGVYVHGVCFWVMYCYMFTPWFLCVKCVVHMVYAVLCAVSRYGVCVVWHVPVCCVLFMWFVLCMHTCVLCLHGVYYVCV